MSKSQFELVHLKSGVHSLRLIENNETFHPGIGPIAEAYILHVDQHRFEERIHGDETFVLWDVGLGAAANVIAALDKLRPLQKNIAIHSFDRSLGALEFALEECESLNYIKPYAEVIRKLLADGRVIVDQTIEWTLHLGDFRETMLDLSIPSPHSIFYDPYSPRGNIDMWNLEHFTAMRERLDPTRPCLMSNYTRSTNVRATWLLAGFYVGVGTAIGEKEETSLAATHIEELLNPLREKWLKRVEVSHSSAPLRGDEYKTGLITKEDLHALRGLAQFQKPGEHLTLG